MFHKSRDNLALESGVMSWLAQTAMNVSCHYAMNDFVLRLDERGCGAHTSPLFLFFVVLCPPTRSLFSFSGGLRQLSALPLSASPSRHRHLLHFTARNWNNGPTVLEVRKIERPIQELLVSLSFSCATAK